MHAGLSKAGAKLLDALRSSYAYFLLNQLDEAIHLSICLAEGLEELGVPILASRDAYERPYGGGLLFRQAPMDPARAGVTIMDISHVDRVSDEAQYSARLSVEQIAELRLRSAVLCNADNVNMLPLPQGIPIFAAHGNKFTETGDRRISWAFGLNRATIIASERLGSNSTRQPIFVRNFRPSAQQDVRHALDLSFVGPLERHFAVDWGAEPHGTRASEAHLRRLATSLGCLAYGGFFMVDLSSNPELRAQGWRPDVIRSRWPLIGRWDSWRFWESLVAGCVTVALDFEEYGLSLPIVPQNRRHYVGVRFDAVADTLAFLTKATEAELNAVAENGRNWALTHYAPRPVAVRFIEAMAAVYG